MCPHVGNAKVCAQATRLSIPPVQLSTAREFGSHQVGQVRDGRNYRENVVDTFGMQVTTEPLKLVGQQNRQCSIDLLRRIPSPSRRSPHHSMGLMHFIYC